MQVSSKEIISLITLSSIIFLIAPLFLIRYVLLYNKRKKKHYEEKILMQEIYETELLKTQIEVQEQTLKTVAYDLHDNIGQLLSLTSVTLSTIEGSNQKNLSEKITFIQDLTQRSIKEVKALSRLLHSEDLMKAGIIVAIEFELGWLARSNRFEITYNKPESLSKPLINNQETIIFRLFQEIINNIIQHAKATKIIITLEEVQNELHLTISDNGIGFKVSETSELKTGMGLSNIKKRTAMLNGNTKIDSVSGEGSTINITIPY